MNRKWRCGVLVIAGLGLMLASGDARAAAKAPAKPKVAARPDLTVPDPIYGVTIDGIQGLPDILASLQKLPRKPTVRIVFDEGMPPSYYREAVLKIHKVAYLLGQPADSVYVKHYTLAGYKAQFQSFLNAFGNVIELWEIGNEVNGNWLGPCADVSAKVTAAYDLVKKAGGKTVLTFVYNEGQGCALTPENCPRSAQYEMYNWANKYVPARVKKGVDYVMYSHYPKNAPDFKPDWEQEFARTGKLFPNAKLGFGELGTDGPEAEKAAMVEAYYPMKVRHPRYVKGFFWWYFRQDMVPNTTHQWEVLSQSISKAESGK